MRKSKIINLTLATSVSAWALASCSEPTPAPAPKTVTQTEPIFATVAECVAGGNTEQLCKTSIEQAQAAVPKFSAKAQCEAEYGVGNCESRSSSGGGDWFGPAMAGFFVGQMLSNNGGGYNSGYDAGRRDEERRRRSAAPVIVGRGGALSSGGRSLGINATRSASGSYVAPRQATVTRSYTSSTSRGGFGRSAGARGSVGG